ncbi:MAG TPA: DinB family protein [Blastocatellia bacterium]|nr:DinB family protein [Blastocatellia bacterium]
MRRSDIKTMPQYYEKYINQVEDVELSQAFAASVRQLEMLDKSALARLEDRRYAPDKWTVKETLQHVIDWERILSYRALLFARKAGLVPQGIDGDLLAASMNANQRTIDSLVEELRRVRLSTEAMFAGFDEDTLQNTGTSWEYEISVLAMGFMIIGHQIHHLKIIEERYSPLLERQVAG